MATTDSFLDGLKVMKDGFTPIQDAKDYWGSKASQIVDSVKNSVTKAFNSADYWLFEQTWGVTERAEERAKENREKASDNIDAALNSENTFFQRLSAGAKALGQSTAALADEIKANRHQRLRSFDMFSGKGAFGAFTGVSRAASAFISSEGSVLDRVTEDMHEASTAGATATQYGTRVGRRANAAIREGFNEGLHKMFSAAERATASFHEDLQTLSRGSKASADLAKRDGEVAAQHSYEQPGRVGEAKSASGFLAAAALAAGVTSSAASSSKPQAGPKR